MRSKILIAILTLVCTFGFGLPAGAITVDTGAACLGVVDFVLLAERTIQMEGGPVVITGNIGVNQPKSVTGLNESIHVGQFNQINGTALGDRVFSGNAASHIDVVEANLLTGGGDVDVVNVPTTCTFPFVANLGVTTGVTGLDFSCLTGVNGGAITIPDNTNVAVPLAAGCYTDLNLGDNSTLTLAAGSFTFNTVTTGIGSTLQSAGSSTLAVKGLFRSGSGSTVSGLLIRVAATTGEVQIGNSSIFNSTIFAPFTTVHIRGGATYSGEVVGKKIIVEPSRNVPPPQVGCGCFETVTKAAGGGTTTLTGGINLLKATGFFLKSDCNVAGGIPVSAVVPPPAATDQTVVLNTAGITGGPFHVIAQFDSGTYCSADLVTLP